MVVVACPYCDEAIELPDTVEGLFECPHCDEEFEWGVHTGQVHDRMVATGSFWTGLLAPFLTACFGLLVSILLVGDSYDVFVWIFISILLWPALALGLGIYGYVNDLTPFWVGASVSFAVSAPLCLLLILAGL